LFRRIKNASDAAQGLQRRIVGMRAKAHARRLGDRQDGV
jgi:hypothetical protein